MDENTCRSLTAGKSFAELNKLLPKVVVKQPFEQGGTIVEPEMGTARSDGSGNIPSRPAVLYSQSGYNPERGHAWALHHYSTSFHTPTAIDATTRNSVPDVKLFYNQSKWKIVSKFCEDYHASNPLCPGYATDSQYKSISVVKNDEKANQQFGGSFRDDTIYGFDARGCNRSVEYGWVVIQNPLFTPPPLTPTTPPAPVCTLFNDNCKPRNLRKDGIFDNNEITVDWDGPSSCPDFKPDTHRYWIDVIDSRDNTIVCSTSSGGDNSSRCKLGTNKERLINKTITKWEQGVNYIYRVYTHTDDPLCRNFADLSFVYTKDGGGDGGGGGGGGNGGGNGDSECVNGVCNSFQLDVWDSDRFQSPGSNYLCWSVATNSGKENLNNWEHPEYDCRASVSRSGGKVDKLTVCYKNKTGGTARVGWQLHRCFGDEVDCRRPNTGPDGDRVEEAKDLHNLQNGKWTVATWTVSKLKPSEVSWQSNLDNCPIGQSVATFFGIPTNFSITNNSPITVSQLSIKLCQEGTANCEEISKSVALGSGQSISLEQTFDAIKNIPLDDPSARFTLSAQLHYGDDSVENLPTRSIRIDNPISYEITVNEEEKFDTLALTERQKTDCNGDGVPNAQDLAIMFFNWGTNRCDANADGTVNAGDYSLGIKWVGEESD